MVNCSENDLALYMYVSMKLSFYKEKNIDFCQQLQFQEAPHYLNSRDVGENPIRLWYIFNVWHDVKKGSEVNYL